MRMECKMFLRFLQFLLYLFTYPYYALKRIINGPVNKEHINDDIDIEKNTERQEEIKEEKNNKYCAIIVIIVLGILMIVNTTSDVIFIGFLPEIRNNSDINTQKAWIFNGICILLGIGIASLFAFLWGAYSSIHIICGAVTARTIFSTVSSLLPAKSFGFWTLLCLQSSLNSVRTSYITAAPLMIADLFDSRDRIKMQCIFYILYSIGCVVGTIFGPILIGFYGSLWRMALRVDTVFDLFALVVIFRMAKIPGVGGLVFNSKIDKKKRSLKLDILSMIFNRSLNFSVIGFGAASFATKGVFHWIPTLMERVNTEQQPNGILGISLDHNMLYELGKCLSVVIGIMLGTVICSNRRKANPRADPKLCTIVLLLAVPLLYLSIFLIRINLIAAQVLLFLSGICLSVNQVPINEIILTTALPTRFGWAFSEKSTVESVMADKGVKYLMQWVSTIFLPLETIQ
ncbi:hypothetical protein XENTR_v10013377 [Xenopus tropicalis]|nr:hypothetical protein XENTR_v10013377 [Xenopus tropicalis]